MQEMVRAAADKAVTEILGDHDNKALRNACTKAFIKGGLFGLDVSAVELRAAATRISDLEGEIWDLKREIETLS